MKLLTILLASALGASTATAQVQRTAFAPVRATLPAPSRSPDGRHGHALAGAAIGFAAGAGITYAILNSGGSTAPCDRSANQDHLGTGECLALYAGGGLVGAGIGALIGSRIRSAPADQRVRIGVTAFPRLVVASTVRF